MRAKDIITLEILEDGTWIDYSDGIISIEVIRGLDEYELPTDQIDVGQMILTTRNQQIDPYVNEYIRINRQIRLLANNALIFTGRITTVNVDYRRKNENSIITLNAVDFLGTMQRHILSDNFIKTRPVGWGTWNLLQDLKFYTTELPGFNYSMSIPEYGGSLGFSGIDSGTSAMDAVTRFSSLNLSYVWANVSNEIVYYPNQDDWPAGQAPYEQTPKINFKSDGTGTSYKEIELNDGFDRIINQISFTNSGGKWVNKNTGIVIDAGDNNPATDEFVSFSQKVPTNTNSASIGLWGPSQINLNGALSSNPLTEPEYEFDPIANTIFIESANPQREIVNITWDATLNPDVAKTVELFDNINIYHELNDLLIDREYSIVGIRHFITESDWDITYVLRNYYYVQTSMPDPEVLVNADIADENFVFEFSVGFQQDEIQSVLWNFGDGTTSTSLTPTKTYATLGTKNVTVQVTNIFNWTKTSPIKQIIVTDALPDTSFTTTQSTTSWSTILLNQTVEGGTTYSWNFGDGNTATGIQSSYSYLEEGTYTITLTGTSSVGSTSTSNTVTITEPVSPPEETGNFAIRYLKLEQSYHRSDAFDFSTTASRVQNMMYNFKAVTSTGTNHALDKNVILLNVPHGYVSGSGALFDQPWDCYYPSKTSVTDYTRAQDWNIVLQPKRLTQTLVISTQQGVTAREKANSTDPGDCYYSEWDLVIDLGAHYNTLKNFRISFAPSQGTTRIYPTFTLYGSDDNVNWTQLGTLNTTGQTITGNGREFQFTPSIPLPANI